MTAHAKKTLAVSILLTVLGALTLPLLTAAWESKVSTADFLLYAQKTDQRFERLTRSDSSQYQMILDLWCASKKQDDRRCKAP